MDNQRAIKLRAMAYEDYLKTPEWAEKREQALERDGHRCRLCNSKEPLHVHHRTYARRGFEDLEDLTTLCKFCHEHFHQRVEQDAIMEETYREPPESQEAIGQKWEDYAIGLLLLNPDAFPHVHGMISESDFIGTETQALYLLVKASSLVGQSLDIPSDLQATASRVMFLANDNPLAGGTGLIRKTIQSFTRMKLASLIRSNEELDAQIRIADRAGDTVTVTQLLQQKLQNSALLRTIHVSIRSGR
jgi:hypothetical protein